MAHAYEPLKVECATCGKHKDDPAHREAETSARKGEEIPRLMRLYTCSAVARQLLGDLQRSRVALANPGFKQAIDDACRHMDSHGEFTYTDGPAPRAGKE